jgi:hypothetical protein
MVKFEFKWDTWMNQMVSHRHRPMALGTNSTTVGTAPTGSNASGIACPERPVVVEATRPAMSAARGDTDRALVSRGCRAGGIANRWSQPYGALRHRSVDLMVSDRRIWAGGCRRRAAGTEAAQFQLAGATSDEGRRASTAAQRGGHGDRIGRQLQTTPSWR